MPVSHDVALTDLLEPGYLQLLQDSFAKITGINTVLADTDGNPITRPSGTAQPANLPGDSGDAKKTHALYRKLFQKNRISKKPALTASAASGLTICAVPVFMENRLLGSWVIAFALADTPGNGLAANDCVPDDAYQTDKLPRITMSELENVFEFLQSITQAIVQLCLVNSDLAQNNSELVSLTEKLESTAQMMTTLTNSADVGLYVVDFFTGEILQGNEQYARFAERPLSELIGSFCWSVQNKDYKSFCPDCPHGRLLDSKGQPKPPVIIEKYISHTDTWIRFAHQAIYWVDWRLAHMVTMIDITQIKRMQQQLSIYAFYDRNLHIPNALKLTHDAQDWKEGSPVYLICFDIIALRTINDFYGRDTGDALLAAICQWIKARMVIRGSCLYRIDGDMFALALPDMDVAAATDIASTIYNRFELPWILTLNAQKINIFCGVAMGVVCANSDLFRGDELLNIIDRTLSRALGDGKIVVYGEEMNSEYKEQLRLEVSLENCVKAGMKGFSVDYQPIVDPSTGAWCALEALCRWKSPEFGVVPPLVFIHKAEQLGLISAIGFWVLRTAIAECKAMGLDKYEHFLLDVNISPMQITDDLLVSTVIEILEQNNYPGEKLSLEVTESTEFSFTTQNIDAILRLRAAKVLVALDDFGTGYSNFNNLKQLPVSILKTERAFLVNIENDTYLQYLFYLMVELAHAAGMLIIAEGVETEEQMRIILKNGVDRMQGYLFSQPLSREELRKNLDKFHRPCIAPKQETAPMPDLDGLLDMYKDRGLFPHMYKTLGQSVHLLLSGKGSGEAVRDMFAFLCDSFKLSRAYIYWQNGPGEMEKRMEWRVPTIGELPAHHPVARRNPPEKWLEMLNETGLISVTNSESLPPDMRNVMAEHTVKAAIILPLRSDSELQGFLGFDDCVYYREWSPEEILLFYNIAAAVKGAIKNKYWNLSSM